MPSGWSGFRSPGFTTETRNACSWRSWPRDRTSTPTSPRWVSRCRCSPKGTRRPFTSREATPWGSSSMPVRRYRVSRWDRRSSSIRGRGTVSAGTRPMTGSTPSSRSSTRRGRSPSPPPCAFIPRNGLPPCSLPTARRTGPSWRDFGCRPGTPSSSWGAGRGRATRVRRSPRCSGPG